MATEPLADEFGQDPAPAESMTSAEYEWRANEIANRLHLLACNSAGLRRAHATIEAERDRVRGLLRDLTIAWEKTLDGVSS